MRGRNKRLQADPVHGPFPLCIHVHPLSQTPPPPMSASHLLCCTEQHPVLASTRTLNQNHCFCRPSGEHLFITPCISWLCFWHVENTGAHVASAYTVLAVGVECWLSGRSVCPPCLTPCSATGDVMSEC